MPCISRSVEKRLFLKKTPVNQALADVMKLYALLPGPAREVNFTKPIPKEAIDLTSHHSCRRSSLKINFLKKFKGYSFGNPKEVAREKFLSYEERCKTSNEKIRALQGEPHRLFLQSVISTAQRKISLVLGKFDLEELLKTSSWGPGSTSSCKDPNVSSAMKFASRPDVTREFLWGARLLMPLLPSWSALLADADYGAIVNPIFSFVKGNRVSFVPKTAETDRVIAVEPHINVFFQSGLGKMIRKKFLRFTGIDLNDQTHNQSLAQLGSMTNDIATIDLEGASDLICQELVRLLLPEDWYFWLNITRSHYGQLDETWFRYEKFSSMGNGATFDLESLIFWSLSSAVVELLDLDLKFISVFGDDIIVPSGAYDKVVEVFDEVGFKVNMTKSFCNGPFRESCGKDWYEGFNVRSIYLKDIPVKEVDWIVLANNIRKLAHEWNERDGCCSSLKAAYDFCVARISAESRSYRVPLGFELKRSILGGYEGNGLLSNWDEASPSIRRAQDGWEGWSVRAIAAKAVTRTCLDRRVLTAGIHRTGQSGNELPLRGRFHYREVSMHVPNWYDMGPWK